MNYNLCFSPTPEPTPQLHQAHHQIGLKLVLLLVSYRITPKQPPNHKNHYRYKSKKSSHYNSLNLKFSIFLLLPRLLSSAFAFSIQHHLRLPPIQGDRDFSIFDGGGNLLSFLYSSYCSCHVLQESPKSIMWSFDHVALTVAIFNS